MTQLQNLLVPLVVFANLSCIKNGPSIDICLVDARAHAFQCSDTKRKWSLTLKEGESLVCASPLETQQFLVDCHKGKIRSITKCHYSVDISRFKCVDDDGMEFTMQLGFADNYVCVSELHRTWIENRCN